jgi:hypothetical protein
MGGAQAIGIAAAVAGGEVVFTDSEHRKSPERETLAMLNAARFAHLRPGRKVTLRDDSPYPSFNTYLPRRER